MVNFKHAANSDFMFQKTFGDGDFIAAGQLLIPPHGEKPSKGTKDNTFVRLSTSALYDNLSLTYDALGLLFDRGRCYIYRSPYKLRAHDWQHVHSSQRSVWTLHTHKYF